MGATTQLPTECARGPTHPFESTADAAQAERRAYPSPDQAQASPTKPSQASHPQTHRSLT